MDLIRGRKKPEAKDSDFHRCRGRHITGRYTCLRQGTKRALALLLAAALLCVPTLDVSATRSIQQIEADQQEIQGELNSLNAQLVDLLTQIDSLEAEIASNEAQIAEAELDLADAQAAEQEQYQEMQLRIQYMYENDQESLLTLMLESGSFSEFLNQVEYANSVYEYDRLLLDSYEATRIAIEELQADLESQRASLTSQKEQLTATENTLNSLIETKRAEKVDIDAELETARAEAARRAAEEAARREAERQAAAVAAANAAAAASVSSGSSSSSGGSSSSGASASSGNGGGSTASAPADSGGGGGVNPAPTTGVSGGAVVGYASQFVGNPYVWGGNSLTNGCDCSGFVVQVYANFGINLSGARSSAALRGVGQAVSTDCMQAGDIVCYSGHVGIYTGAGTIVEAQSSRAGITSGRSVYNKPILAVRRVI